MSLKQLWWSQMFFAAALFGAALAGWRFLPSHPQTTVFVGTCLMAGALMFFPNFIGARKLFADSDQSPHEEKPNGVRAVTTPSADAEKPIGAEKPSEEAVAPRRGEK